MSRRASRFISPVTEFLRTEAGSGVLLLAATVAGLVWASALGRIGFTVSLFITGLAFTSSALRSQAKST